MRLDDPVVTLAESLSDFEACLDSGEEPNLEIYREVLGPQFDTFVSLLDTRGSLMDLLEPPTTERLPRPFGTYTLLKLLGRGGAGRVYEARNNRLGRLEAVKILSPLEDLDKPLERFEREAQACARTDHPNVVQIHRSGVVDDTPYLAMERVDGVTLKQWAPEARRDPRALSRGMAAIADALHAVHRTHIVHRDVKPSNVMVRKDGSFVLMDFGLVRDALQSTLTDPNDVLGTPFYMAPEQMRGERATPRTDVYAVGATLYHTLCGAPPFEADSIGELVSKVIRERPEPIARRTSDVPEGLSRIVMKCLEKEPGDRYADAAALRDDLRAFAEGQAVSGRPVGPARRATRAVRRRALAIGAAIVLMGAAAAWWQTRDGTLRVWMEPEEHAELYVGGVHRGKTPVTLDVARGPGTLEMRLEGFLPYVDEFETQPGGSVDRKVPLLSFKPEAENAAAMRRLLKLLPDLQIAKLPARRNRGAPDADAAVVYPHGAVQVADLVTVRVEVYDPDLSEDEPIVFRKRGGDELGRVKQSSLHNVTERPIPQRVREALKPGDVLEIRFADAVSEIRIVASDPQLAKRLTQARKALKRQDQITKEYAQARLLMQAEQYQAALALGLPRCSANPALASLVIVRGALEKMGAGESELAKQIELQLDEFPEDVVDAWIEWQ